MDRTRKEPPRSRPWLPPIRVYSGTRRNSLVPHPHASRPRPSKEHIYWPVRHVHRGTPQRPGRYDREVPLVLHEWDPFWEETGPRDVGFKLFSVNGKMLGAGEPVRVRAGQRVLFRIVNASATLAHRMALPGHTFFVLALGGNTVPAPRSVPVLELGPGERIDAVVEMDYPGMWVLASADDKRRAAGMGIVAEYADAAEPPRWATASTTTWDYTSFGEQRPPV